MNVFEVQGVITPSSNTGAQIVSNIWSVQYFGTHLEIEDGAPWVPNEQNFKFVADNTIFWQPCTLNTLPKKRGPTVATICITEL